jgi:HlyD family secretion protein
MKKKILIGLLMALVVIFVGFAIVKAMGGGGEEPLFVKTSEVTEQDLSARIFADGTVVSKESFTIRPEISGEVAEILVAEGDAVAKGDTVLKLKTDEVERQIEEAKIALAISEENLLKLRTQGTTQFDLALSTAKKRLDDAKKTYEDQQQLFAAGAISQSALESARLAYELAQNEYTSARRNFEGYGLSSDLEVARLNVENAKLRLDRLEDQLEKMTLRSPIDGTVTTLNVEIYDLVGQSTTLFTVDDLSKLEVVSQISEYDIKRVDLGQPVVVTGDALRDARYEGTVAFIGASARRTTSGQSAETVVEVRIDLEADTAFKPNFSADIEITTDEKDNALVVPYESLYVDKDRQAYVFKVNDENRLERVPVTRGIEGDLSLEVLTDALTIGDRVVLNPTETFEDGRLVEVTN